MKLSASWPVLSGRMRILLVSDLHYTLKQLDWVMSVADSYDLVVIAGDHLDIGSAVEPDAQIAVVLEYLSRIAAKTHVVACSGNHDLNARNDFGERSARWLDAARESGVGVDGMCLHLDGATVTVCPWWDGPRTREVVDRQLALDAGSVARPALDLDLPRAARRLADELDGQAPLRRRRPRTVDRTVPARLRSVRARAPVAVLVEWCVDRPHRYDHRLQRRTPDRPGADANRSRHQRRVRPVGLVGRRRSPLLRRRLSSHRTTTPLSARSTCVIVRFSTRGRDRVLIRARCPRRGCASGCRAPRRSSRGRLRGRRTAV